MATVALCEGDGRCLSCIVRLIVQLFCLIVHLFCFLDHDALFFSPGFAFDTSLLPAALYFYHTAHIFMLHLFQDILTNHMTTCAHPDIYSLRRFLDFPCVQSFKSSVPTLAVGSSP